MLHNVCESSLSVYEDPQWDIIPYFLRQRKAGRIRHLGFSMHDTAEALDETLTAHPEVEFVQLQINYLDWEDSNVQSRLCYEVARKHGKDIIVMEPVKGGTLADPPQPVKEILTKAEPDMSPASCFIPVRRM